MTRGRFPPGQHVTEKRPVLHARSIPQFDPHIWDFRIVGLVETSPRLDDEGVWPFPG